MGIYSKLREINRYIIEYMYFKYELGRINFKYNFNTMF
jgi:hypothetical protein